MTVHGGPLGHGIRGEESFTLYTSEYFELLYQPYILLY